MKNYYQQKKGGWNLDPVIYAKTVKQIQCYRFFERIVSRSEDPETRTAAAKKYLHAVDQALEKYVPGEYRAAVFAHLVDGAEYLDLEEKYFISSSTMKRYVQVFVWGVAEELGEQFADQYTGDAD